MFSETAWRSHASRLHANTCLPTKISSPLTNSVRVYGLRGTSCHCCRVNFFFFFLNVLLRFVLSLDTVLQRFWLCCKDGILIATKYVFHQKLSALCMIKTCCRCIIIPWVSSPSQISPRPSCFVTSEVKLAPISQPKQNMVLQRGLNTNMDLITVDNRVSSHGDWGEYGGECPGRGFHSLSVFSFSSWALSWLEL